MRKYIKPQMEVIELQIAENIAALIPKTIYKTGRTSPSNTPKIGLEFGDKDNNDFKDSSII